MCRNKRGHGRFEDGNLSESGERRERREGKRVRGERRVFLLLEY
jgi:hypothetical protein